MIKLKSILPIEGTELVKVIYTYGKKEHSKVVNKEVDIDNILVQENQRLKVQHGSK